MEKINNEINEFLLKIDKIKLHNDKLDFLRNTINTEGGIDENNWDKIRKGFTHIWTKDRVSKMTLEEYTDTDREYAFTYWVETILIGLGNIKGSTSIKFGIYKKNIKINKNKDKSKKKGIKSDNKYEWYYRYGDNAEIAFNNIKDNIINIIKLSTNGKNYNEIDSIDISNMFKWKIAFLYDNNNFILPIYSYEKLIEICNFKKIEVNKKSSYYYIYLSLNNNNDKNLNLFTYFKELWLLINQKFDILLIKYDYYYNNYKNNNTEDFGEIYTINEHLKILENKGKVYWGIFGSEDNETKDNLVDKINKLGIKEIFLQGKSEDGINIIHYCTFNKIIERDFIIKSGEYDFIPSYYNTDSSIKYYFEIESIKQFSSSILDYFYPINAKDESIEKINNSSIRKYLGGRISNIELAKKEEFEEYDIKKLENKALSVKKIIGIKFNSYYGLNRDLGYIDLSNGEYIIHENGEIKNGKKENIFDGYGINNFNCILGRNGYGKSRIIQSIINYFNDWQNFNPSRSNIESEDFDIFFLGEDDKKETKIVKSKNSKYIGITLDNNEEVVLNLSKIKNIYISNSLNDPLKLENNNIGYNFDETINEFSTYDYLGITQSNVINKNSYHNDIDYLMLFIHLNSNLRSIFYNILDNLGIHHNFYNLMLSFSNNRDINEKIRGLDDLYKVLNSITNGDEFSKSFFSNKKERLYLKDMLIKDINADYQFSKDGDFYINIKKYQKYLEKYSFKDKNNIDDINNIFQKISKIDKNNIDEINVINKYVILEMFKLLIKGNILNVNFITNDGISFINLSAGEQTIINHILKLIFTLYKNNGKNINIFFDEPDITLHPEWQRHLINSIIEVFKNDSNIRLLKNSNLNTSLLLTTHSPIIVSDIPKNNIISISKNEKTGKLFQEKKLTQTFLNNLYELYANPFFVNSFVGEFAAKYFHEALEKNYDISNMIGDNIIKNQFLFELDDKNEKN